MPTAVIMPKFEMAQETGTIGTWVKTEGDAVRKGDIILEVETDKVNMEVEASADGILMGIVAGPGEVIPIGRTIAYIVKPGEAFEATSPAPITTGPEPIVAQQVSPQETSSQQGSASPVATRLAESLGVDVALVPGTGPRGQVMRADVEAYAAAQTSSAPSSDGKLAAAPAARRLARELGVELQGVRGTGPAGRIQPEDVRAFRDASAVQPALAAGPTISPAVQTAPPIPVPNPPAIRRMVPLTNIRRTVGERMTDSVREAPQFNVSVETDMTRALAIVEDLRSGATADQPRVTLTALLVKACAWGLCQNPGANAAFQDGQIAEWADVNVGVATAIDAGLIVPVIHQVDKMGLRAIAARMADLTALARAGKLKLEDLQGGTFTLSNLGMFGIDQFTAILNPPQAAILAVGRVAKRPFVTADERIEVRPTMMMTLTADHRVLDGATAARFLATIQQTLEHPGLLLL